VLLLSRNRAYEFLNGAIAAPLTTRLREGPTMIRLEPAEDGVPQTCVANLDALQFVLFATLEQRITMLGRPQMERVDAGVKFALSLS
jgi:mRNA-degrading endonuclease toxin of MazEF toxin-antitoxin module